MTTYVVATQFSNIPTSDSDALRVVQVQARPILNFILFQRRIDESVLCFSRWIEQHERIRSASARIVLLMEGHFSGPVKNGAQLIHQVLYRVGVLNT